MPISGVGEVFNSLRKLLQKETRLFTSRCLLDDISAPEDEGDLTAPGLALAHALKTKDGGEIRDALTNLIGLAAEAHIRQSAFVMHLERLLVGCFDGQLSLQQLGELKDEVLSAVTISLTPAELSEELADILLSRVQSGSQMEKGEEEILCENVAAYIRRHHKGGVTTAALGKQFGFTSTQLAKKFKLHFGISISEYVNQYRIELAQAMMRENRRLMVKEVAAEIGYNDQYYFSKTFKKITGVWPTEYLQDDPDR